MTASSSNRAEKVELSWPACNDVDTLGFICALLPVLGREGSQTQESISSTTRTSQNQIYQPILGDLDIEKNVRRLFSMSSQVTADQKHSAQEPLVLAASLTMSFVHAASTPEERVLLLKFLHEIAEVSPAVVLLV